MNPSRKPAILIAAIPVKSYPKRCYSGQVLPKTLLFRSSLTQNAATPVKSCPKRCYSGEVLPRRLLFRLIPAQEGPNSDSDMIVTKTELIKHDLCLYFFMLAQRELDPVQVKEFERFLTKSLIDGVG